MLTSEGGIFIPLLGKNSEALENLGKLHKVMGLVNCKGLNSFLGLLFWFLSDSKVHSTEANMRINFTHNFCKKRIRYFKHKCCRRTKRQTQELCVQTLTAKENMLRVVIVTYQCCY